MILHTKATHTFDRTSGRKDKTTGHIETLLVTLGFALSLILLIPAGASALELNLTTSNDLIAGKADDLYTAELGVDFHGERFTLSVGERLFTDREVGIRFDETHLAVAWPVEWSGAGNAQWLGRWTGRARVEALRVGRGIAGEPVQNAIHRVIGSDEVDLNYPDRNRHFLGFGVELERPIARIAKVDLAVLVNAYSLPGFQHRLEPSIGFSRSIASWLALSGYAGVQLNETQLDKLDRRVETSEETWQLALDAGKVRLAWNYNSYGTASRHLSLSYRVGTSRPIDDRN